MDLNTYQKEVLHHHIFSHINDIKLVSLKVGSCPNDDNFVHFFIYPFLCSILIILLSESVAAKKTARFF